MPIQTVGTTNADGTSGSYAREDHVHAHGDQTVGSLHAAATASDNGFMSAADKLLISEYFGSHVIANLQSGADIGAQINAACAALAGSRGVVQVLDGDYVMTTRVVIPENVSLRLGAGTISNAFSAGVPPFLMKSDTSIIGCGFATKLMSPIVTDIRCAVIGDYVTFTGSGVSDVANSNLVVRDIQFIPNPDSDFGGQNGAITFGNIRNALVEHCLFNGCEGYGACQASDSSLGNYGDGFTVRDCIFENLQTQHLVTVNCINFFFVGNLFRPTEYSSGPTFIDCEPNIETDSMRNFVIAENIFDISSSPILNPGNMIQVVSGGGVPGSLIGRACYGVISDNVCVSGDVDAGLHMAGGIMVNGDQVAIDNNVIGYCFQAGISLGESTYCTVRGNRLTSCGGVSTDGGGAGSILVHQSIGCTISDNVILEVNGENAKSTPRIVEQASSDYNTYSNNQLMICPATSPFPPLGYNVRIDLVGANSRVFGTTIGSPASAADASLVATIAELRGLAVPGSRNSAAPPPVVLLGGFAGQGDGGFSVWKYDDSSTDADNGVTVVKPTYLSGSGRWIRAFDRLQLSTTQRDALSLTSGDSGFSIDNTTTGMLERWNGTGWDGFGNAKLQSSQATLDFAVAGDPTPVARLVTLGVGVPALLLGDPSFGNFAFGTSYGGLTLAGNGTHISIYGGVLGTAGYDNVQQIGNSGAQFKSVWAYAHAGSHQSASAAGAVTIDTQLGEMCAFTATGNITSLTLTAGLPAQRFTLELVQGSSAGFTWPVVLVNARLDGGAFSKTAAVGARDVLTFQWNDTDGKWDQLAPMTTVS